MACLPLRHRSRIPKSKLKLQITINMPLHSAVIYSISDIACSVFIILSLRCCGSKNHLFFIPLDLRSKMCFVHCSKCSKALQQLQRGPKTKFSWPLMKISSHNEGESHAPTQKDHSILSQCWLHQTLTQTNEKRGGRIKDWMLWLDTVPHLHEHLEKGINITLHSPGETARYS